MIVSTTISSIPMHGVNNLFFELLQVALCHRYSLSHTPSTEEWEEIYKLSKQHTLHGVAFAGVERLPKDQLPPPRRIRQWAIKAERLRDKNHKASEKTVAVSNYFIKNGFHCIILKGQGNAINYPEHLKTLRTPGDIDVWAWPLRNKNHNHDIRDIVSFCLSKKKGEYIYYHNLDFPILSDIPVEVHYRPTWLYNPIRNHRLQKWFTKYKHTDNHITYDGYLIPNTEFNVVFQLLHLYKHIFEEGIGLRQLLDYYMVLSSFTDEKSKVNSLIKSLGLNTFAAAVMHVIQQVFLGTDEQQKWMLCVPSSKEGEILLHEIMQSGNFGQYDERYNWAEVSNGSMRYRGLSYAVARLRHNIRFLASYPSEVLCEPFFRIYNKLWVILRLWRYE